MKKIKIILALVLALPLIANIAWAAPITSSMGNLAMGNATVHINPNLAIVTCKSYLQDLAKIGPQDYVAYSFATTRNDGEVTYASGLMTYDAASGTLVDTGTKQYFSDRSAGLAKPFDPTKTDNVGLTIYVNDCKAKLTYLSQGNAINLFDIDYESGLLYGSNGQAPETMIVIATKKIIRTVHA